MLAAMSKRDSGKETDSDLWERVAKSTRPLAKDKRVSREARPKEAARKSSEPPRPSQRAGVLPKEAPKPKPAARGEMLDRQTARRLERGRLSVEARIDLHGMRQREAHAALRRFLKSAQRRGHRHVLVITGKGAGIDESKPFYEADERGVLRQAVPHWLSQPDLAPVVISYSEAPRRLGGEGALYVRIRAAKP
jgi:DNA-nicking Smr family endonuclease